MNVNLYPWLFRDKVKKRKFSGKLSFYLKFKLENVNVSGIYKNYHSGRIEITIS